MWWMKRRIYSFISSALCQFSNANIVRQYIQKFESSTSLLNNSSMRLLYSCSSGVKNSFIISIAPASDRPNLPSVWASSPRRTVARCSE